jgi:hypothetical protein
MCLVSLPINEVYRTNIFVGLNKEKTKQITIFSNVINNTLNKNAIIIPVPYLETLNFHNMENIPNFFVNLDKSFKTSEYSSSYVSDPSYKCIYENKHLKKFKIGNYKISLFKNLQDLLKYNNKNFIISDQLKQKLIDDYKEKYWCFIALGLEQGFLSYKPFAFSHNIINSKIYIPTKKFYYHKKPPINFMASERLIGLSTRMQNCNNEDLYKTPLYTELYNNPKRKEKHWSHNIYFLNYELSGHLLPLNGFFTKRYYYWNNFLFWNPKSIKFDFGKINNFEKIHLEGDFDNIDIVLNLNKN